MLLALFALSERNHCVLMADAHIIRPDRWTYMPATKRTVTGKLLRPDGSAWGDSSFMIRLITGFSLDGVGSFPPGITEVATDANGAFSVDLYPNPAGEYEIILPTGLPWFKFTLPPGNTAIDVEDLQEVGVTFEKPSEEEIQVLPLVIEKGQPFEFDFTYRDKGTHEPVDLTGAHASFVVTDNDGAALLTLVDPTNITINGTEGNVQVNLSILEVNALTFTTGEYTLKITFTDLSSKTLFSGALTVV